MPSLTKIDYAAETIARLINELRAGPIAPDRRAFAREWLHRILLDSLSLKLHLQQLQRAFDRPFARPKRRQHWVQGGPPAPPDREGGFPFEDLLDEQVAQKIVDDGPDAFDAPGAPSVESLLLNPFALCELADLIDWQFPESWGPLMVELGKEAHAEYRAAAERLSLSPEEMDEKQKAFLAMGMALTCRLDSRPIPLPADPQLAQQFAAVIPADAGQAPSLRIIWRPAPDTLDKVLIALEMSPPPLHALTVHVTFPTGTTWEFAVPAGGKGTWASSTSSEPVPLAAVQFTSSGEWTAGVWPPELRFPAGGTMGEPEQ